MNLVWCLLYNFLIFLIVWEIAKISFSVPSIPRAVLELGHHGECLISPLPPSFVSLCLDTNAPYTDLIYEYPYAKHFISNRRNCTLLLNSTEYWWFKRASIENDLATAVFRVFNFWCDNLVQKCMSSRTFSKGWKQ